MKVLISHDSGAHFYDRLGFEKVLNYCGYSAKIWNISEKSAHDAFSEHTPDLFIGQLHNIDRATFKCLEKYRPKVILKAGHFGPIDEEIDTKEYPVLIASNIHKEIASQLKEKGLLDYVFVHYPPKAIESTMGYWNKLGIKPVSLMNACDTFSYLGGEVKDEFESQLSFIGGNWPYKAKMLSKYLYPLCYPVGKFNIKIYGNSSHPVGQYVGGIDETNVKHMFVSSLVNLDVAEPHAYDFSFDVSEKLFKVGGAGGFYLSCGKVLATHELFSDGEVKYVEKEEEIWEWILNHDERALATKILQDKILSKHTYFDRVSTALFLLGFLSESELILKKKDIHLNGVKK